MNSLFHLPFQSLSLSIYVYISQISSYPTTFPLKIISPPLTIFSKVKEYWYPIANRYQFNSGPN